GLAPPPALLGRHQEPRRAFARSAERRHPSLADAGDDRRARSAPARRAGRRPEERLCVYRSRRRPGDPEGGFGAGTMDDAEREPSGDLYRLGPNLAVERFAVGFAVTNGIDWSN